MTEKGRDDQSGQLDAQDDTKSTATMQGCAIRASNMVELPTIGVRDAEISALTANVEVEVEHSESCNRVDTTPFAAMFSHGVSIVHELAWERA